MATAQPAERDTEAAAPEQMYAPGLLVVSLAFNALGESLRIVRDPTIGDR